MAGVPRVTPLDQLQLMFNEVLVQTGKALKSAHRDGKSSTGQTNLSISAKVHQSAEAFNYALDDLEGEIVRAKSTFMRDLQQQAKRNTPQPQPAVLERSTPLQESKPVAPPAPMVIDLEPPPKATPVPAPVIPQRPIKQEPKASVPVAPFPNMGYDLTSSPEVTSAPTPVPAPTPPTKMPTPTPAKMPTPTPAKMPTPKPAKMPTPTPAKAPTPVMNKMSPPNPARPTPSPAAARPASTPPKKESKIPVPQVPRSAAATPQAPAPASIAPPAPAMARAVSLPTAVTSPPSQAAPENLFTNMGFTVAPPFEEPQPQNGNQNQNQTVSQPQTQTQTQTLAPDPIPESIDLTGDSEMGGLTLESFGISSVPGAEIANMSLNLSGEDSVDAKIDGLFDLGPNSTDNMDMDYDLGAAGDNSNFDDLFFNSQDDNIDSGEFNDAYFGL